MYSKIIRPKVDILFNDLKNKVSDIVNEASTPNEATDNISKLVSSELATRSKSILSDMMFDLSDALMNTEFFSDIARQNKFSEINLRQEILSKYKFAPTVSVNYKEAAKTMQALKVGGATLVIGGATEIGAVLISGLSISSLFPIPISILIIASIGASLADYYAIEPIKSKKTLTKALDNYLVEAKLQFLNWFDEVESYFNRRVEDIKLTL